MKAEIITIGTELLLGQIIDTNSAFIAQQLANIGFDVYRKTSVGDNEDRISAAISRALQRSDVVITTGGLGPTVDDKTREAVAMATERELYLDEDLLKDIKAFFKRRGLKLGENNPLQAQIPTESIPIHNPVGTAPGFIVKFRKSYVISLPGVPHELHHLMENTVLPFLKKEFDIQAVIKTRVLRTAGEGESNIDRRIAEFEESTNPTVGLAAHPGAVDIRISAKAPNEGEALKMLDEMETQLRKCLGNMIYGTDKETIEEIVIKMLADQTLCLAVYETNTGGHLTYRLTSVPGGMQVLDHTFVASFHRIEKLLPDYSEREVSISKEISEELAEAIQKKAGVDIGMALIGDEDPDVGPYSKRTGSTYIGLSDGIKNTSRHIQIGGISGDARTRITNSALDLLRRYLQMRSS
jgi:nicotinamide-nucleotide amidase